ncbi:putative ubiquitin-conjugating enzyme/RWD [Helianthus anomalus]
MSYSEVTWGCKRCILATNKWAKKFMRNGGFLRGICLVYMIYVRVYEGRKDLLRVAIIGPEVTPYHDGFFSLIYVCLHISLLFPVFIMWFNIINRVDKLFFIKPKPIDFWAANEFLSGHMCAFNF